jgi:hypothetical protein
MRRERLEDVGFKEFLYGWRLVSNEKEKDKAIRFFCVKESVWVRVDYDKKRQKNEVKIRF